MNYNRIRYRQRGADLFRDLELTFEKVSHETHQTGWEPAAAFYARLTLDCGVDLDLEQVIRQDRTATTGLDLISSWDF
jgi:hypothetical protein